MCSRPVSEVLPPRCPPRPCAQPSTDASAIGIGSAANDITEDVRGQSSLNDITEEVEEKKSEGEIQDGAISIGSLFEPHFPN